MTERRLDPIPQSEAFAAELFSHLQTVEIPAELRDDAFLAGVYARAAAAETASLGPILGEVLIPLEVPDVGHAEAPGWHSVAWNVVTETTADQDRVAAAFRTGAGPAPGLLWNRIRADIQEHVQNRRADRQRATGTHWMRRAAAAILISACLAGFFRYGTSYFHPEGTLPDSHFVFREAPELASASLDQILGR